MWYAEHTLETSATPERVWREVAEVTLWPEWDEDLAWADLSGPFAPGSRGKMKPRHGGLQTFRLSAVVAQKSVTVFRGLFLGEVRHIHVQEPSAMGTRLTHRVEIAGFLGWLYGWTRGPRMRDRLAPNLRRLARIAAGD